MLPIKLTFESALESSPAEAWAHITSLKGISREMWPYLRMTAPAGVENISSLDVAPGQPLFYSRLYLLGVIPIGHSCLTLVELKHGEGFVEQSPMSWMRLWRHERRILPAERGCVVTDRLTFHPLWAAGIAAFFVRILFNRRHAVLRRLLGGSRASPP